MGEDDFGLWTLIFSVVGFLGLLDMGLGAGVVKFVAEAQGAGDPERRNRVVSTIACVYLALAALAAAGLGVLSLFFNSVFNIPPGQGRQRWGCCGSSAGARSFWPFPWAYISPCSSASST